MVGAGSLRPVVHWDRLEIVLSLSSLSLGELCVNIFSVRVLAGLGRGLGGGRYHCVAICSMLGLGRGLGRGLGGALRF